MKNLIFIFLLLKLSNCQSQKLVTYHNKLGPNNEIVGPKPMPIKSNESTTNNVTELKTGLPSEIIDNFITDCYSKKMSTESKVYKTQIDNLFGFTYHIECPNSNKTEIYFGIYNSFSFDYFEIYSTDKGLTFQNLNIININEPKQNRIELIYTYDSKITLNNNSTIESDKIKLVFTIVDNIIMAAEISEYPKY